jgi:carbonic anhydrase
MVVHTDMNMLSVLDYAVNVLKVTLSLVVIMDAVVFKAAMGNDSIGIIDN